MPDQRLIPLSALQHYRFCPRQCALIHTEQQWAENFLTAHGQLLHQRVDGGEPETRKGVRFERSVEVCAPKLGLLGKLDLLEVNLATGEYTPVEYKRGRPKKSDIDAIQLCAQALCLEEMSGKVVSQGALWYWQTKRRESVRFDKALRNNTLAVVDAVRSLFACEQTPQAQYAKRCKACSLVELCHPQLCQSDPSQDYIKQLFSQGLEQ